MRDTGARAGRLVPISGFRWVVVSLLSMLIAAGSYVAAVRTTRGQAWENATLRGITDAGSRHLSAAIDAVGGVLTESLVIGVALIMAVALVRRRLDLAVAGAAIIVGGQIITQLLKRYILPRPSLVLYTADHTPNSFPSGHTTVAMTVLLAALIVVPHSWRALALLLGVPWAWSVGAYTLASRWHRLSDVLGAEMVALLCACLASWWLVRRGSVHHHTGPARPATTVILVLVAVVSAFALIGGLVLVAIPMLQGVDLAQPSARADTVAYLAAQLLAIAAPGLTAVTFWGLWHRLDT